MLPKIYKQENKALLIATRVVFLSICRTQSTT